MVSHSLTSRPQKSSPRWAIAVLAFVVCLLPLTGYFVRAAIRSNLNDVRDWLPAHFPETAEYRWFREQFGSEEFVVVSWPGCDLNDTRLEKLAANLASRTLDIAGAKMPLFARVGQRKPEAHARAEL